MTDINDTDARPDVSEPGRDVSQNSAAVAANNAQAFLPLNEAEAVRAQERLTTDGKAESPEREALYQNLEGVGESGTQTGTEDLNPIGERTG